jgi:hypothetical protein
MNTMRSIGQTLSMGTTMVVMAVVIGRVLISPETYPALMSSIKISFIIFAVISFGGVLASLSRVKSK